MGVLPLVLIVLALACVVAAGALIYVDRQRRKPKPLNEPDAAPERTDPIPAVDGEAGEDRAEEPARPAAGEPEQPEEWADDWFDEPPAAPAPVAGAYPGDGEPAEDDYYVEEPDQPEPAEQADVDESEEQIGPERDEPEAIEPAADPEWDDWDDEPAGREPEEPGRERRERTAQGARIRWGEWVGRVLPASARRARRQWAAAAGLEFAKEDDFLSEELQRGAAGAAGPAKDVVSGLIGRDGEPGEDYEFYLFSLGSRALVALRTGGESPTLIELHRSGAGDAPRDGGEDLVPVLSRSGFDLYSSNPPVATRWVDERVERALELLPAGVDEVWFESAWVVAVLPEPARGHGDEHWGQTIEALSLIADACRTLPPRGAAEWDAGALEPTRPQPPAHPEPDSAGGDDEPEEDDSPVTRPDEPAELPSRDRAETYGAVGLRQVGADEVDAIAEDADEPTDDERGTRVVRRQPKPASIFDDLAADLGIDPSRLPGGAADDEPRGSAGEPGRDPGRED